MYQISLRDNWYFKPASNDAVQTALLDWMPATVPGTVQQDLLAAGIIRDPYQGMNEKDVQWVGEQDWSYRCTFDVPADMAAEPVIDLVCDGLDTIATVWLNDHEVYRSVNMFVALRATVTTLLRPQGNELRILFKSPWLAGKEREAEGGGPRALWNGDSSRLYLRKAQYHYGWDWGPTVLTVGPWLPVRLEAYQARIADLNCSAQVSADLTSATLPIELTLDLPGQVTDARVELKVFDTDGVVVQSLVQSVQGNIFKGNVEIANPQLWWPKGYGKQPRYRIQAILWLGEQCADVQEQKVGLRRVELVRRALQEVEGESFFFRINNTPIFCGGANWIPADLFLSGITEETYRNWLTLAADANMVMIRVWGGGIYEADCFYDLCDEMGLLVWQDFMFACGIYPADEAMLANLRAEAEAQITRLRRYASIVLWAGNNEDYSIATSRGYYTPSTDAQGNPQFPARVIYEQLLPEICARLDPTRTYWPGSPYGGDDPNSGTQGDRHTWEVWNTPSDRYQNYAHYRGRFVSEFGMQGAPSLETLLDCIPESERYLSSPTLAWHNKAEEHAERLQIYFDALGRTPANLAEFVYITQCIQSEAMSWAIRGWRRFWRGEGREEVSGALVWQLNDCWPVISWALADNVLRPKAAYYEVRRALAPLALGAQRSVTNETQAELWVMNQLAAIENAEVVMNRWTLDGQLRGSEIWHGTIPANRSLELPEQSLAKDEVLSLRLIIAGEICARFALWPEFKATWPDPQITVEQASDDTVLVSAKAPAHAVWLGTAHTLSWSDNGLDILPDDPQSISAPCLLSADIQPQWFK
jgi:beta-mannosidase